MKLIKGYTIIEIIMVIIIVGVITGIAAMIITAGTKGYVTAKPIMVMADNANITMSKVMRELRSLFRVNAASTSSITFVDQNSNTIIIDKSGTNLRRKLNSNPAEIFCDNVGSAEFKYYDATLTETANINNIRYISLKLELTDGTNVYPLMSGTLMRALL